MTYANPTFNAREFELRNIVNKYLSPEQKEKVDLTTSRVNGQLNFLAQMLGWNGQNYWGDLPSTVSQKRQLLGGSFGVYNSFVIPRIFSVRNWSQIEDFSSPQVAIVEVDPDDRIKAGQTASLGIYSYTIQSIFEENGRLFLNFGEVDDTFFTEINSNTQLRIDSPQARPNPFYRPNIGVAGDNAFTCKSAELSPGNWALSLYPEYDTSGLFLYRFPILFAGSAYSFDKPVYLAYDDTLTVSVSPVYDEDSGRWTITIPGELEDNSPGIVAYLVWSYTNSTSPVNSVCQVKVQSWEDPSDWGSKSVLDNFLGAWGNKGGFLPFDLAFDSLSVHGFDENKSLYLPTIEREIEFNDLVDRVYTQRAVVDSGIPGTMPQGKLWWNTTTGKLAVQIEQEEECPFWVETVYREAPEQELIPEFVFPDIASFNAGQSLVPTSTISVLINDITGLSPSDNILNINDTFSGPGRIYVYKQTDGPYWVPIRFEFTSVNQFSSASPLIPYGVPTYILNSSGLSPSGVNYTVNNLDITVTGFYETVLVKENGPEDWTLFPDSILKFIANSITFGGPSEGDLWWDYTNPSPANRSAQLYYNSTWVALNTNAALSAPPTTLDMGTVLFYCDGKFLSAGVGESTEDYEFSYTSDPLTGKYIFSYSAFTLRGKTKYPLIEISDSLTSSYRLDVTSLVFSGVSCTMSPNVYDAETPLRLWKSQHLQVADSTQLLNQEIYPNALVADQNSGPTDNWQKFFVRLPLDYERNGAAWQKTALICQDFAYYGSSVEPESMSCPPNQSLPKIYEEICLENDRTDYTYIYSEPYLFSTAVYDDFSDVDVSYSNAAVRPTLDQEYDEFMEAQFIEYEPLHNRLVDFTPEGFGNWQGIYVNASSCDFLSGYLINDLADAAVEPITPPIWDASIYKCPPTCDNDEKTYSVDANNFKICYAYFAADASAAEDGFFDPQEEAAWRFPLEQPRTRYLVPNE